MCCVPTNLYGKYDNYSTSTSHVVAALIRKGYNASLNKDLKFEIYGSGTPMRQFCSTKDLCKLILWQLLRSEPIPLVSFVPEEEYSIRQLAEEIAKIYKIVSQITFDTSKADGQFKKTMGNKIMKSYLKNFKFTSLSEGLNEAIQDFK